MFRTKKNKKFFNDKVKKLMRLKKNKKLKTLIEKEETYPTLNDSTGTSLLHMAARYDNIDMMQYLIGTGCGIDAKDASGTTPLIIATKYNNNLAMELLLGANADIFITNSAGEYPLQLAFNPKNQFFHSGTLKMYCERVKDISSSIEEAFLLLLQVGCSLVHAAIAKDVEITRMFLRTVERFDEKVSTRSVMISMILIDTENLRELLSHGSQVVQRRDDFFSYLQDMTNTQAIQNEQIKVYKHPNTLKTVRAFAEAIINWDLLKHNKAIYIIYILRNSKKDILRAFLESGIIDYAKDVLGYSILPQVYGNRNEGVVDLVGQMGLHSRTNQSKGPQGISALHVAAYKCIAKSVKVLLDVGVGPNIADEQGRTPLWYVLRADESLNSKIDCMDLLLRSNADVEICNDPGISLIEYLELDKDDHLALADHLLAHLAMLAAAGSPLKQSTMAYINAHDELRNRYENCQQQLDEMEERKIAGFLSLVKVLTSNPDEIAYFVGAQDEEILTALTHVGSLSELNEYYAKRLKINLNRALRLDRLRTRMAHLIVESIRTFNGYTVVVDKIVGYFSLEELLILE